MRAETEAAHGYNHPIHDQPGHEEVDPLERMEANRGVLPEAARSEDHDRSNPAEHGDIAEDGGGAGSDAIADL
jgi:hypothetical protein